MKQAMANGSPIALEEIDRFVDGAAVKRVGNLTYQYCMELLDQMLLIPEGKICTTILKLYNEDAIVVEPAGALAVASLDQLTDIEGKNVVCIVSGGNNDIERMQEIKEKSLLYEGLKHYFIVRFPRRPGALKLFVNNVLGPHDDITRFEFIKKTGAFVTDGGFLNLYKGSNNLRLYYHKKGNTIVVFAYGEFQPGRYMLYLEGFWIVD